MHEPKTPPRWADRFLEWYCRPELLEEIQGDLHEIFHTKLDQGKEDSARLFFIWNVFRSFRLSTIRSFNPYNSMMIKSNFKITLRQMSRQKGLSAIKIGGFSLGVAACLLIGLFVQDELSFDRYHPDVDQIHRMYIEYTMEDGRTANGTSLPAPISRTLEAEFPEVEISGRFNLYGAGSNEVRRSDQLQNHHESRMAYADQEVLDIFQYPMVAGNPKTALAKPNSIILSRTKAQKYFPATDPIGQTLILNNNIENPFKITGVFEDWPSNSHMQQDFLLSLAGKEFFRNEQDLWYVYNYDAYLKLRKGTDVATFEKKLEHILVNFLGPAEVKEGYYEKVEDVLSEMTLRLQPVKDIHLYSADMHGAGGSRGDIRIVRMFSLVAFFILLLAGINFINLTTAKSTQRMKEVGIRKVMGSQRISMIYQFLTESTVYSFISIVLGLVIAQFSLPFFNQLSGKTLEFPWTSFYFFPFLTAVALAIGVLAGSYPAFHLSRFLPIDAFRARSGKGKKGQFLQNSLVVFQFSTAIVLIVGTLVIYRQMQFILNKDLGFDKEQVILIQGAHTLGNSLPVFKERISQLPMVRDISVSNYLPVSNSRRNTNAFWLDGQQETANTVSAQRWEVDHNYVTTMGMKIIEGRDFDLKMATDSHAIIINRAMADQLNTDQPLGSRITNGYFAYPRPIIGIVENFHFESLKEKITPLCLSIGQSTQTIAVKISNENLTTTVPNIKEIWDEFAPHQALRYSFLDERFTQMYEAEKRTRLVFSSFTIIAIVVACMGLFALATFMADQRSKEISIRKILGATVVNLFRLLTQNFLMLILISCAIAIPVAWYLSRLWLRDYTYSIELGFDLFVYAALAVVLIALATISRQAIKVATTNPIDAIRSD